MNAQVNGRPVELYRGATVADVVGRYGADESGRGVAVAVNGEVVARSAWPSMEIVEGDRIEVLGAIGGG